MNEVRTTGSDPRRAVALIVGIVAAVAFVALSFVIYGDNRQPLPADVWWHALMLATLTTFGVVMAFVPSTVGGTIGMIVIAVVLVVVFVWRKRPWDAANIATAIALVVAIGAPMSYIVARVRPDDSLAESTATSYPSGHTAVATTVVVTLALLLRKWYLWVGGIVWVLWMMWARTYLHAHWLSDVFAGLLEGIAVATLVWCAYEAIRARRAARSGIESPVTS